jgi:hypothetical protein
VLVNVHVLLSLVESSLVLRPVVHRQRDAIARLALDKQLFERIEEQLPLEPHRSMAHPEESNRSMLFRESGFDARRFAYLNVDHFFFINQWVS